MKANGHMGNPALCSSRSSGQCKWCGCTEYDPCPEGCGWADRVARLCSACVPVDQAWKDDPVRPRHTFGSVRRRQAFFRGFLAASQDERAIDASTRQGRRSPFVRGSDAYPFWRAGVEAGKGVAW